jgi:carbohydrate diacid regulator
MNLTEQLAQSIVDKMMEVVPYNVNIMNNKGFIVGSGDKSRIGKLHEGALQAIEKNKLIIIDKSTGGSKPGVNMPIYLNGNIVGVIGISGEPSAVEPFASIVKVTAELLINQEFLFNERRIKERQREEFLYRWRYQQELDDDFIDKAASLNIDLSIERVAVLIKWENGKNIANKLKRYVYEGEYILTISDKSILVFMKAGSKVNNRVSIIEKELDAEVKIGIGAKGKLMRESAYQALRAVEIVEKLKMEERVCEYKSWAFVDILQRKLQYDSFAPIIEKLEEEGRGAELLQTLTVYTLLNGDINAVTKALHIHRNSLNYRLKKVEEITGRDPKRLMELLELFTACIMYKLKQ